MRDELRTPGLLLVYETARKKTGENYIGIVFGPRQTIMGRWQRHIAGARRGENYPLEKAIRRYGPSAFYIPWIIARAHDRKELGILERFHIAASGSYYGGYNHDKGGKIPDAAMFTNAMQKLARNPEWLATNRANGFRRRCPDRMLRQIFGKLTVLDPAKKLSASGHAYWKCQCACGRVVEVAGYSLRAGTQKSCGKPG